MMCWSISSALPFLAQGNNIALESCTFRIIFCWLTFMPLSGGMETAFSHHCWAFPPSFLVQHHCSWCGPVLGETHLFPLAAWIGPWFGSPCGLVSVMRQCCVALPFHWQLALHAILKQCSWCGIARVGDASVLLEQNICPLGWIFHLSQKKRHCKLSK